MTKSQNDVHRENLSANATHVANLQALEAKRMRRSGHDIKPIYALTYERATIVASVA